jgi:hypothetical protein
MTLTTISVENPHTRLTTHCKYVYESARWFVDVGSGVDRFF